ncbi:MAG: hypothetical protein IJZ82_01855 [Lachnospiraceae bacterium]|nr:hypothetical protein [Lachnospiraceae bacterium]
MIRLFEQHKVRPQKELEGIWRFVKEDGKEYSLPVPGCWEQHPELMNYRGTGSFYRRVEVSQDCNLRLEFKGVSHTGDVYFDGEKIAHHYNAFTPFSAVVRNVKKGSHEIKVFVDNRFTEESSLHVPNDYYTYGGLTRPVAMEELGDVYIKNVHFLPTLVDGKWQGTTTVKVENLSERDKNVTVKVSLAGVSEESQVSLAAGATAEVVLTQEYEDVKEWNVGEANLYYLEARLLDDWILVDDFIDRVGFRQVTVEGRRIKINGKSVFLKGFNRHEDYGKIGCAIPVQLMAQDMDLMQELGSNAVRTCHYPNDERFLDLCDERGMLVWEENHARGFDLKKMQNPHFDRQCEDCINEMIEYHYNHPSIVIWGILNECASETPEGREKYKKQFEQIKSLDTSRPTTFATCRHFTDICLDLPDMVSFNIYSGWYQDISVKERHEQEMDWIESTGGAGKPVIVSEFGAGAIYGNRDRTRAKWSEERQADIIKENLLAYAEDDRLSGTFIWQFADCRVTQEEWFAVRPRSYNNKGVVDEYRRPKEAFDVVKELFPLLQPREE